MQLFPSKYFTKINKYFTITTFICSYNGFDFYVGFYSDEDYIIRIIRVRNEIDWGTTRYDRLKNKLVDECFEYLNEYNYAISHSNFPAALEKINKYINLI